MKLTPRQTAMLRWIAHSPRQLHNFTGAAGMGLSPRIAQHHLDVLEEGGYVEQHDRGTYAITQLGACHLTEPDAAPSRLWGPWSTPPGSYVAPRTLILRPGALQHLACRSVGVGC